MPRRRSLFKATQTAHGRMVIAFLLEAHSSLSNSRSRRTLLVIRTFPIGVRRASMIFLACTETMLISCKQLMERIGPQALSFSILEMAARFRSFAGQIG